MSDSFHLTFSKRKETKGAVVYQEVDTQGNELKGDKAVVGTLYMRKVAFPHQPCESLTVTIVPA